MHIGTLSWDILLVTVFLMCCTKYHGDYFSVDSLRRGKPLTYKRKRPFFIQRLLQLQIASTFFYTALYKVSASGNWLNDNPIFYLMQYPPQGVTKQFIFREFFATQEQLCFFIGITIVVREFLLPFALFHHRTRTYAIGCGIFFHFVLVTTLHVPTIFFFLFPPQLLLFINPDRIVAWVEKRRAQNHQKGQCKVVYDGHCHFCVDNIKKLLVMDLFGVIYALDYQREPDLKKIHPDLNKELCHSQLHMVEPDGSLSAGFYVFRRLSLKIPMLYPLIPLFYFPGAKLFGPMVYRWIANNRYLFHSQKTCQNNTCFRN